MFRYVLPPSPDEARYMLIESMCHLLVPPLVLLGGADSVRLPYLASHAHDR